MMSRRRTKFKSRFFFILPVAVFVWLSLTFRFVLKTDLNLIADGVSSSRALNYGNSVTTFANGTAVQWKRQRPALRDLISRQDGSVIGNPDFLLHFGIIGHGKCGTTTMANWLSEVPEVRCPKQETLELALGTVTEFISKVYIEHPPGHKVNGYKSPGDIRSLAALNALSRYFPRTLLIVGIRHPVLWFESLYNFKVQNLREQFPSDYWGDPNQLIGKCSSYRDFMCVGTAKGLFHLHLSLLGKTNHTEDLRRQYPMADVGSEVAISETRNPVFLFDVEQLADENEERMSIFRKDIQNLVGLSSPLSPRPPKIKPGKRLSKELQESRDNHKIDICDSRYDPLRAELMRISNEASEWILHSGFLDNPDVYISSPQYFRNILEEHWKRDPCPRSTSIAL